MSSSSAVVDEIPTDNPSAHLPLRRKPSPQLNREVQCETVPEIVPVRRQDGIMRANRSQSGCWPCVG